MFDFSVMTLTQMPTPWSTVKLVYLWKIFLVAPEKRSQQQD